MNLAPRLHFQPVNLLASWMNGCSKALAQPQREPADIRSCRPVFRQSNTTFKTSRRRPWGSSLLAAVVRGLIRRRQRDAFLRGLLVHGGSSSPELQPDHSRRSVVACELLHLFDLGRGPRRSCVSRIFWHNCSAWRTRPRVNSQKQVLLCQLTYDTIFVSHVNRDHHEPN